MTDASIHFVRFRLALQRFAVCAVVVAALAGCGVRGTLEAPAPPPTTEGAEQVVETPQDDAFILDGLLL